MDSIKRITFGVLLLLLPLVLLMTLYREMTMHTPNVVDGIKLLVAQRDTLLSVCYELLEFVEDQVDVIDGDYGVPAPNKAMTLYGELKEAILKAGGTL